MSPLLAHRASTGLATAAALAIIVGCGGKKPTTEAAIVGWHKEEGWAGECYFPPAWASLGPGDRKIARAATLDAMMSQWTGKRDENIRFSEDVVEDAETALLGKPDWIEAIAGQNLAKCKEVMAGGSQGAWSSWLRTVEAAVNKGECPSPPLTYTLFDYLDIGKSWQIPAGVCKGDRITVLASSNDYYRLAPDGPWINADGDPDQRAVGEKFPCNLEGCMVGMVIMKFEGESGMEQILPVGTETQFVAPEHGAISVTINETEYFDNKYKKEGSIIHHTAITYQPTGG